MSLPIAVHALALALLHSLWQGAVIAFALAFALRLLRVTSHLTEGRPLPEETVRYQARVAGLWNERRSTAK